MEKNELNYSTVFDNMVKGMENYVQTSGMQTMILGISGGIDSTVVAAVCHEVSKRTGVKLIGVSLMCSTNQVDEVTTADLVGEAFCDEYYKENIENVYKKTSEFFVNSPAMLGRSTKISEGNIKARIRMMYLWNLGGLRNGVVMDTDNMTEHYLGFWTIMGDSNYITPIGQLWKTEVYGLAKYLVGYYASKCIHDGDKSDCKCSDAIYGSAKLIPTDGNGVSSSDLEQIAPGYTYYDVDDILRRWVGLDADAQGHYLVHGFKTSDTYFAPVVLKYGEETVKRVIMRSVNSEFKRKHLPLSINIDNGDIVEKR